MSGSGGILEYQRELTARLEQVMRERDEARAEVERLREENKLLRYDADEKWGAVATRCASIAERQREACAQYMEDERWYSPSAARRAPLVTEEKP